MAAEINRVLYVNRGSILALTQSERQHSLPQPGEQTLGQRITRENVLGWLEAGGRNLQMLRQEVPTAPQMRSVLSWLGEKLSRRSPVQRYQESLAFFTEGLRADTDYLVAIGVISPEEAEDLRQRFQF